MLNTSEVLMCAFRRESIGTDDASPRTVVNALHELAHASLDNKLTDKERSELLFTSNFLSCTYTFNR